MSDVQAQLRKAARDLLEAGKVDVVLGFQDGSLPLRARPCFARDAAAADRLVWNRFCTNNLAAYLPRLFQRPDDIRGEWSPPKVAMVAKACDARSAIGLTQENQVIRDDLVLIAMPCQGMVDPRKVKAVDGSDDPALAERDDLLAEACLECVQPAPGDADIVIEGRSRAPAEERFRRVREFEALSPAQRWQRFIDEISKCIRCYACRQACPNCYCKTCFIDQSKPSWAGAGDDLTDLLVFHVGRLFHQAGRCVECDACVRACPMGVDLRLFTGKLVQDVEELFGYVPGASDQPPPLNTHLPGDSECFITEP